MKTKLFTLLLTAVHLHFAGPARAGGDYVAHEWGTFTSVQAADGTQLLWNPLIVSDLPGFVYDRFGPPQGTNLLRLPGLLDKSLGGTLQRMETPVIYFYADREQTVDVAVKFPQGLMTEWYPQVRHDAAAGGLGALRPVPNELRWDQVRIMPRRQHEALAASLPLERSGSHYYAARETDADFLRMEEPVHEGKPREVEKFLFYRGVGNFRAPLTTRPVNDGQFVSLQNTGPEELRHLFIYTVRDGKGKFVVVDRLSAGTNVQVEFNADKDLIPLDQARDEIAGRMRKALVAEGLYEREAAAMVATWDESWFSETGLRVLYVLSREWTDRVLPLKLNPAPRELARVMVGRAELITPSMEWELMKQIVRYSDGDERDRAAAVANVRKLDLGRFMEAVTRRLQSAIPSRDFGRFSHELLQAASKSEPVKPLAAK